MLTINEFDIGFLRALPRRMPFPDGWALAKVTLDEPLEVLTFGGGNDCYHNVLRDNFGQGYHQYVFAEEISVMINLSNSSKWFGFALIFVQLFDAAIHIATDQFEPTRITANIVIIVWIIAALMGWIKERFRNSSLAAIGVYLLLNLIFLTQNGLTNPEQGGALRTTLFLLVFLTVVLSALLTFRASAISD